MLPPINVIAVAELKLPAGLIVNDGPCPGVFFYFPSTYFTSLFDNCERDKCNNEIVGLKMRLWSLESAHQSITLDLASRNFGRLDTDTGMFLVSVQDASPYLDGYKLSLEIGNPFAATYKDFTLKVKWNKTYDWAKYTDESYAKWDKTTREKEISFTTSLEAGRWNKVDLILPSTAGDELGYFVLSMDTKIVSLKE